MMTRLQMIWRSLLALLSLIILCLIAFIIYLLTPAGLKTTLHYVNKQLPGQFSYQNVSGNILSPIDFTNLHYQDQQQIVTIQHLRIHWDLWKLFIGKLYFKSLNANDIVIINPSQTHKSKFTLPFTIEIKKSQFQNIFYGNAPHQLSTQFSSITLSGLFSDDKLNAKLNLKIKKPYTVQTQFTLSGRMNQYQFKAITQNSDFTLQSIGSGTSHSIQIHILESDLLGGSLKGTVALQWQPQIPWQANLQGKQLSLKKIAHKLPQLLDINLVTHGKQQQQKWIFDFKTQIKAPYTVVNITASHNQQWQAQWNIHSSDLGLLYSELQGKITSQGQLIGTWPRLKTNGIIHASQIRFQQNAIEKIQGNWRITRNPTQLAYINLELKHISAFGQSIKNIIVNAQGTLTKHQLMLSLINEYGKFTVAAHGSWDQPKTQWQGQIDQIQVQSNKIND